MNSPNAAPPNVSGDHAGERQPAHHPDDRLGGSFLRCRCVRLAVAIQVDRQHRHDHGEQRDPGADGHVEVDELGTIGGSNERSTEIDLSTVSKKRTVEGLAPAGGGRGAGQQAAVLTTDPEGYSPSTRSSLGANVRRQAWELGESFVERQLAGCAHARLRGPIRGTAARRPDGRPTACAPRAARPVARRASDRRHAHSAGHSRRCTSVTLPFTSRRRTTSGDSSSNCNSSKMA